MTRDNTCTTYTSRNTLIVWRGLIEAEHTFETQILNIIILYLVGTIECQILFDTQLTPQGLWYYKVLHPQKVGLDSGLCNIDYSKLVTTNKVFKSKTAHFQQRIYQFLSILSELFGFIEQNVIFVICHRKYYRTSHLNCDSASGITWCGRNVHIIVCDLQLGR